MSPEPVGLLVLVGTIVMLIGVASFLDRRAKAHGNLFTGRATMASRLIALLFALVFGGFFVLELVSAGWIHLMFPAVATASLAYALGWNSLMDTIQRRKE